MIGVHSFKKLTMENPMRRDLVRDLGEHNGSNTEEFKKQ